jgi:arsenate reductase
MKRVMFVCKHNSRRSQIAEGFARQMSDDTIKITSSGLEASQVDPLAIEVMREVGIDISQQTSKPVSDFDPKYYDAVISLCGCGVNLPSDSLVCEIFIVSSNIKIHAGALNLQTTNPNQASNETLSVFSQGRAKSMRPT